MDVQTEIPKTNRKITTKPIVIPPKITALYSESIFTEMKIPSTTQHSGGASYVNYHCLQLIVQNHQTTRKNICYFWWNIYIHMIITITYIEGLENIQEVKYPRHYYKFHLYLKIMMLMMMKINTSICNQVYNIIITMKCNNQGA